MCEDQGCEQIARFIQNNKLSWTDWLQVSLVDPFKEDRRTFIAKVQKFGLSEQDAKAVAFSDEFCVQIRKVGDKSTISQVSVQLLEQMLKRVYLPRLQHAPEVRIAFEKLFQKWQMGNQKVWRNDQIYNFAEELLGDNPTVSQFIDKCVKKDLVTRRQAELITLEFKQTLNGYFDKANFLKVFKRHGSFPQRVLLAEERLRQSNSSAKSGRLAPSNAQVQQMLTTMTSDNRLSENKSLKSQKNNFAQTPNSRNRMISITVNNSSMKRRVGQSGSRNDCLHTLSHPIRPSVASRNHNTMTSVGDFDQQFDNVQIKDINQDVQVNLKTPKVKKRLSTATNRTKKQKLDLNIPDNIQDFQTPINIQIPNFNQIDTIEAKEASRPTSAHNMFSGKFITAGITSSNRMTGSQRSRPGSIRNQNGFQLKTPNDLSSKNKMVKLDHLISPFNGNKTSNNYTSGGWCMNKEGVTSPQLTNVTEKVLRGPMLKESPIVVSSAFQDQRNNVLSQVATSGQQEWVKAASAQDFVLYEAPSISSQPIAQIYKGQSILVCLYADKETHWVPIKVKGLLGWMLKIHLPPGLIKNGILKKENSPSKQQRSPPRQSRSPTRMTTSKKNTKVALSLNIDNDESPQRSTINSSFFLEKAFKEVKSIPLDVKEQRQVKISNESNKFGFKDALNNPLDLEDQDAISMETRKDINKMFRTYEEHRNVQLYGPNNDKEMKHRSCAQQKINKFKSEVYTQLIRMREDPNAGKHDEELKKLMKFINMILMAKTKSAFRKWKEESLGFQRLGGNVAVKNMLVAERERVRDIYIRPCQERRLNIKQLYETRVSQKRQGLQEMKTMIAASASLHSNNIDTINQAFDSI